MRPTLRRHALRLTPIAIVVATTLAFAASSSGITLYDGSYATDLSSSTPGGLTPANGTSLPYPSSNIELAWDQVPGASRYQLQVARQKETNADCAADGAFQIDNVVLTVTTTQNEWAPTLETAEQGEAIWTGAYCWRVRTTGKGYGEWSSGNRFLRTWSSAISGLRFYNDHDGTIPRTSSASDFASGSTQTRNAGYLTWDDLAGASEYEVQVSPSRSFSAGSIVASREGISDNQVILLHLPDDTYYWRVRGVAPNGTEGAWSSGSNTFTVKWQDPDWSTPANLYPADSSIRGDVRIGWTPMPGASHYEYQVGTNGGCFWDPTVPTSAPDLYGSWTDLPVIKDATSGAFLATQDPQWTQCRLSSTDATTINNWVTLNGAFDPKVFEYIARDCWDESEGEPLCEAAAFPDNQPDDRGVQWRGPSMSVGQEDGDAYQLWWRVRPVYTLNQDSETGWKINGDVKVYGSWTRYKQGGANREHRFEVDPTSVADAAVANRCDNPGINPLTDECLVHVGSSMQATDAFGTGDSATLQVPVVTWQPFAGAGGYVVQYARDPLFNNMERTVYVPGIKSTGYGFQTSYVPADGMIDNAEGSGIWWRVIPCTSQLIDVVNEVLSNCAPFYSDTSGGLPTSEDPDGYADMGVAQEFEKRVQVQTSLVENFAGATPLIRWAVEGASESDAEAWSAGIPGTHHYEVQLARDPFMSKDEFTLSTTIPRIAPFMPGEDEGESTELPDGIWYYRVRPVDRNGIEGSWSEVSSFNKRVPAPVPSGSNGVSGPGVVVTWSAVQGAGQYQVQWSTDSGFEKDVASGTTRQTAFRIPDSPLGRQYWRVRAVVDGVEGQWSGQARYVDIVAPTTIRYGLNRTRTLAKDRVQVTGELKVAGAARNGERLRLQRKTGGCDSSTGRYVDSSVAVTGDSADDGMVNVPARVQQNTCFRFAWASGSKTYYSSPIPASVVPNVRASKNRKVTRRSRPVCVALRTNVAVSGRMRFQYRAGKTWRTARSTMLRGATSARACAQFTKAGRYPTRITLDRMLKPGEGWVQYDDVMRGMGVIRVNDVWRVVRSR